MAEFSCSYCPDVFTSRPVSRTHEIETHETQTARVPVGDGFISVARSVDGCEATFGWSEESR